jgi:3-hydroxyisobutyrate dehydrogenase-like beta-hydroxyacid dehydrogenase
LNSDGGVFQSASPNTMICDTSTISPIGSKEFSQTARELGLRFCDSPMSGGIMGAQNGTLTFMVGAHSDDDFAAA